MSKSLEALDNLCCGCYGGNDGCNGKDKFCINYITIKQDLEHKTQLENENKELKEEYEKLKKALDKACKRLDWDCPVSQDLIDDLDCENRCSTDFEECCRECWKIYFLKEVLVDE